MNILENVTLMYAKRITKYGTKVGTACYGIFTEKEHSHVCQANQYDWIRNHWESIVYETVLSRIN